MLVALQYYKAICETVKYVRSQGLARFSRKSHGKRIAARPGGPDSGSAAAYVPVLERTHIYADVNAIKHAPILLRQAPSSS